MKDGLQSSSVSTHSDDGLKEGLESASQVPSSSSGLELHSENGFNLTMIDGGELGRSRSG